MLSNIKHNLIHKFTFFSFILLLVSNFAYFLEAKAQTANSLISLSIISVTKDGQRVNTRRIDANNWIFDGSLSANDDIRYQWQGIDLALRYQQTPAIGGGWLKLYLNEVTDANFLLDLGSENYPLKISEIAARLNKGENKLLFVYVNSSTKIPSQPAILNFNFAASANPAGMNIVKPATGSVFMKDSEPEVVLELDNFELTNTQNAQDGAGKLNIYYNQVVESNLLGIITTGEKVGNQKFRVTVKPESLDLKKIPDSLETKLIFVLTDTADKPTGVQAELPIKSNYQNSIDVGLPRLNILEPKKDRSDLSVNGDTKFILQNSNFELLAEPIEQQTQTTANANRGFLQIQVIDGEIAAPIQTMWPKLDFTLNEIGYSNKTEGKKTVRVQLVNENFELLKPEVNDSIDIFYQPQIQTLQEKDDVVQNNSWRIIIISLTILLIVGGIAILITKG